MASLGSIGNKEDSKDVAGEDASHHTRGRVCSPACFTPALGEDLALKRHLENAPLFYIAVFAQVKPASRLPGGQAHLLAPTASLGLGTNSIEKVEIERKIDPEKKVCPSSNTNTCITI
jgi:hypothetical protein